MKVPALSIEEITAKFKEDSIRRGKHQSEERSELWAKLTKDIPEDWKKVTECGCQGNLNEALNKLLSNRMIDRLPSMKQKQFYGISSDANKIAEDFRNLGEKIARAYVLVSRAQDREIFDAAAALLDSASLLDCNMQHLLQTASNFIEHLPEQKGGPIQLSKLIEGESQRFFYEFCLVSRDIWRKAGLPLGGNAVPDQGFSGFLDAVHTEVFGCTIPGRGALLAKLRDTWPRARF